MAYILTKSNGRVFATVADGSIDQSASLTFVGKNYAGYGQILGQNFLYLLENFANISAPANPLQGQIWYDTVNSKIKVYNGSTFRPISFTDIATTPPADSQSGDFWFNTANNQLSIRVGNGFTAVSGGGGSSSGGVLTIVKDSTGSSQSVLRITLENQDIAIFSLNSFSVNASETAIVTQFPYINKGLTFANTTLNGSSTAGGSILWGTAATANQATTVAINSTTNVIAGQASTGTYADSVVVRGASGQIWGTQFYNDSGVIGNGFTGSQGGIGDRGFTGSASTAAGFTGSQGIQGAGFTGSRGSIGVTGFTGSAGGGGSGDGFTGSQGSIGFTGSAGSGGGGGGFTGSQGSIGFTGSRGIQGAGFTGSAGFVGSSGASILVLNNNWAGTNNFASNLVTIGNVNITGGQINTAAIGATSPGTGVFSTIAGRITFGGEVSGTLSNTSANRQIQITGNVTLPASGFVKGDIILIDPGGTNRTISAATGLTMYFNNVAVSSITALANGIVGVRFRESNVCTLSGNAA